MRGRAAATTIFIMLAALLAPAGASARRGGDDEVRARGTCGGGAKSEVKVKADDGALEVEIEVEHVRSGSRWSLTLAQEGRVAWRGAVRARSGRFEVRRTLRDLAGADRVRVTARGPNGVTCRAALTLPGD